MCVCMLRINSISGWYGISYFEKEQPIEVLDNDRFTAFIHFICSTCLPVYSVYVFLCLCLSLSVSKCLYWLNNASTYFQFRSNDFTFFVYLRILKKKGKEREGKSGRERDAFSGRTQIYRCLECIGITDNSENFICIYWGSMRWNVNDTSTTCDRAQVLL